MSAMQKLVEQMQAECLQIHADHTAQMAKLEDELAAKQRVLEQKREEVERLREERTIEDDHTKHYRSILICYFPRECSEEDIRDASAAQPIPARSFPPGKMTSSGTASQLLR